MKYQQGLIVITYISVFKPWILVTVTTPVDWLWYYHSFTLYFWVRGHAAGGAVGWNTAL